MAIDYARTIPGLTHIELTVETANLAAIGLYRNSGFKRWGTEPSALKVGDKLFDEDYMSLSL